MCEVSASNGQRRAQLTSAHVHRSKAHVDITIGDLAQTAWPKAGKDQIDGGGTASDVKAGDDDEGRQTLE